MFLVIFITLPLIAATNSAPVLTNNQQLENQTCFSSCHPGAQQIHRIYDLDVDEGVFWSRNGFLPPCFCLSRDFVQSQCLTCIDRSITPEIVQVFCLNLTPNMNLIMEGPEGIIRFNKTMCPLRPTPLTLETQQRRRVFLVLPFGCFFICLFCIILLVFLEWH